MKKDIFRIGVRVPDHELQTIEDVVQWFRTEQARQIEALVQGITEIVTAYSDDWAYVDAVNDGPEDQIQPPGGNSDSTKSAAASARISGATDVEDHLGAFNSKRNMMDVSLELQRHKAARAS